MLVGTHPWKVIIISAVITGLICIGVPFTFTQSADGDDTLWVPVNADVLTYKSWISSVFPSTVRVATMIFVDTNVLTAGVVQAVSSISQYVGIC